MSLRLCLVGLLIWEVVAVESQVVITECEIRYGVPCHRFARCIKPPDEKDHECVCNEGYIDDGTNCKKKPKDECEKRMNQKCHKYAECVKAGARRFKCRCKKGFKGDGMNCQGTGCIRPAGIPNGRIMSPQKKYGVGNAVTYQCNNNYKLLGDMQRVCQDSGEWSGRTPKCEVPGPCHQQHGRTCHEHARCERPQNEKDFRCVCSVGYSGDGINCNPPDPCYHHHQGRSCHHNARCDRPRRERMYKCVCNDGFDGDGVNVCHRPNECERNVNQMCHRNAECVRVANNFRCKCKTGYTGDGTTCQDMGCKRPRRIANGRILTSQKRFVTGNIINYQCNQGYEMQGKSQRRCLNNGKWSGKDPRCQGNSGKTGKSKRQRCPNPSDLQFGFITSNDESYKIGAVLTYECQSPYTLKGDSRRSCQKNGKWSGSNPRCTNKGCSRPNDITHGKLLTSQLEFVQGNVVTYQCDSGYTMDGDGQVTCMEDGSWTDKVPRCQEIRS